MMKYRHISVFFLAVWWFFSPVTAQGAFKKAVDQLGRQVVLPDDPRRVVALAPSITEIIFAIGQEHRLKGVTRFANFPAQAAALPKVGSYVHLDLEKIIALQPDLCIAIKDGNPRDVVQRLEALGIPVFAVDPKSLSSVQEAILQIGELLNATDRARSLVQDMKTKIHWIASRAAKAADRPRVFFQIGISPIVSVGTYTFAHELIGIAGGNNLTQGPIPYPQLSLEQVLALAPEVIIISSMERGEVFERVKRDWESWPSLPAVKNRRVFLMDSDLVDRPTPRLVDGLQEVARRIHPELFGSQQ